MSLLENNALLRTLLAACVRRLATDGQVVQFKTADLRSLAEEVNLLCRGNGPAKCVELCIEPMAKGNA